MTAGKRPSVTLWLSAFFTGAAVLAFAGMVAVFAAQSLPVRRRTSGATLALRLALALGMA